MFWTGSEGERVESHGSGGEVERRGRLAAIHALGLLDIDGDPLIEAVTSGAGRMAGGRCHVWLRGPGTGELRAMTGGPREVHHDPDPKRVRQIQLDGIVVGEVRGQKVSERSVAHVATEIQSVLQARWRSARHDDNGNPVGLVTVDSNLDILWMSEETHALGVGAGVEDYGSPVLKFVSPDEVESAAELLDLGMGANGPTLVVTLTLNTHMDGPTPFDIRADNRLSDPEVQALTFVLRRSDRAGSELALLGDQIWVLNRLSAGQPLGEVLHRVTDMVENHDSNNRVCIMELDESGTAMHPLIAPRLPVPVVGKLVGLKPGAGQPAGAGALHMDIGQYTSNVATDPSFAELAPTLIAHGIRACWSIPIRSLSDGKVLGTIDVYRTVTGTPGESHSRVLAMAGRLAAIAMDQDSRERNLRHQAMHDPLTDLANRAMFAERLSAAAEDGNVGVLFLDLDRFKLVNDTLGHEFGDEVLRAVARRLDEAVEEPILVARFGGDEFTVLVPKVEVPADLVAVGEQILRAISVPYNIRDHRVVLRASVGAALALGRPDDPQSLVRDADTALYFAKERGRGRVEVFDDRMAEQGAARLRIEAVLRDAIEGDRILVHFQPTVRLVDGVVMGAEALARCVTAAGDFIPPDDFIPVAEDVGLLPVIFETVLTRACEMAKVWNKGRSEPFSVWVNLSPTQLGSSAVVGQIARIFGSTGVDPAHMGFEVTESGILPDPDQAADFLSRFGTCQ